MENINESITNTDKRTYTAKQVNKYNESHGTGVISSIMFVMFAVIFMAILASYIH